MYYKYIIYVDMSILQMLKRILFSIISKKYFITPFLYAKNYMHKI